MPGLAAKDPTLEAVRLEDPRVVAPALRCFERPAYCGALHLVSRGPAERFAIFDEKPAKQARKHVETEAPAL